MIVHEGRRIPETVDELVDPAYTAYVIVDLQNDFCKHGGSAGEAARQKGLDIEEIYAPTIDWSRKLLDVARAAGVMVVHIQNTALPHRATDSAARLKFMSARRMPPWRLRGAVRGRGLLLQPRSA